MRTAKELRIEEMDMVNGGMCYQYSINEDGVVLLYEDHDWGNGCSEYMFYTAFDTKEDFDQFVANHPADSFSARN